MELKDILTLVERLDNSSLTTLTLTQGDFSLTLEKAAVPVTALSMPAVSVAAAPAPAAPAVQSTPGDFIKAPLVGTFYSAPAPDKPAFVSVGDTVKKGKTVCVLEAMKMMSEVPAPADCVIEEVLLADGALAGFDAPLFRVRYL